MMIIEPGHMNLAHLRQIYDRHVPVQLTVACHDQIHKSVETVADVMKSGKVVYGVNTGFGKLAQKIISEDKLSALQENLVLSHACGVGAPLDDHIVRLIMVMKINALAQGYSGVRLEVIEALVTLLNHEIYPVIPEKGSVGASGDLAPLAHLSAVLLGAGQARRNGKIISGQEALQHAGLEPLELGPKEGLALLNGTQVSTALALSGLFMAERAFMAAVVAGALTVDASKGSPAPFHHMLQKVRGQKGQIKLARMYEELLEGSEIRDSHLECDRVQDPYCLRCMPQVMGACLDHIAFVASVLEIEANAVSDNPLVFSNDGVILSGGNFHAEPVAMAADTLALAIAEIGNMSERRIAMLIDSGISQLPPFLTKDAGLHSGFMIAHVTAAALASENKQKSFPACVDSIPTSANQEDHVSMATHGARRLLDMAVNTATIVGIELLAAAQGISFHRPLQSSTTLEDAVTHIRQYVPELEDDRFMAPDLQAVTDVILSGEVLSAVDEVIKADMLYDMD